MPLLRIDDSSKLVIFLFSLTADPLIECCNRFNLSVDRSAPQVVLDVPNGQNEYDLSCVRQSGFVANVFD